MPAQAGIQYAAPVLSITTAGGYWIPAFAGMTMAFVPGDVNVGANLDHPSGEARNACRSGTTKCVRKHHTTIT